MQYQETLSSRGIAEVIGEQENELEDNFIGEIGLVCKLLIQAVYAFLYGSGDERKEAENWIFGDDQSAHNSFDNLMNLLTIDINPDVAREALLKHIPDRRPFADCRVRRWNCGNEGKGQSKRGRRTRTDVRFRNVGRTGGCQELDWIQCLFDQSITIRSF